MRDKRKLSYSNVTSTLALFLALAGGTTAIALSGSNTVRSDDIVDSQVHSSDIGAGQVRSSDIGGNQVLAGDIAANQVSGGKVKANTLFSSDIGEDAVGASELAAVPAVRVTAGVQSFTDNLSTPINFTSEASIGAYDPLDMWSAANPAEIVVPVDGIYIATGRIRWNNDDTDTPGGLLDQGWRMIQVSGPHEQEERIVNGANRHGAELMSQGVTGILNLAAGETVTMQAAQSNEDFSAVSSVFSTLTVTWVGPRPGPPVG
jgi:hypothetical protein